jgi:hypothetical protein
MPPAVIRHLRKENIIKSEKDGVAIIFDKESIEEFQKDFIRGDYLTKRECDAKIEPMVTRRDSSGVYVSPCDIWVTGIKLITGSDEIPDEYRWEVRKFGTAIYITKKSFEKTFKWLESLDVFAAKKSPDLPPYVPKTKEKKQSKPWMERKVIKRPSSTKLDEIRAKMKKKNIKIKKKKRYLGEMWKEVTPHKSGWSPMKRFLKSKAGYFEGY